MEAYPETSGASLEVRLGQNHEHRGRQSHAEGGETLCNSAALVVQFFFPVTLALVLVKQWLS